MQQNPRIHLLSSSDTKISVMHAFKRDSREHVLKQANKLSLQHQTSWFLQHWSLSQQMLLLQTVTIIGTQLLNCTRKLKKRQNSAANCRWNWKAQRRPWETRCISRKIFLRWLFKGAYFILVCFSARKTASAKTGKCDERISSSFLFFNFACHFSCCTRTNWTPERC